MEAAVIWGARAVAVLLGGAAGWLIARVPADWRLDRFNDLDKHALGSAVDASDSLGMYSGCLSAFASAFNELHDAWRRGGCLIYLLPVVAVWVAAIGWPPDPAIWRERGGFVLIVVAPWLWVPFWGGVLGYLAGRLTHRRFFND